MAVLDLLRALACLQAGYAIVLLAIVMWRDINRARLHAGAMRSGQWPLFVSYMLLLVLVTAGLFTRIYTWPSWRIPVAFAAFLLGDVGLSLRLRGRLRLRDLWWAWRNRRRRWGLTSCDD